MRRYIIQYIIVALLTTSVFSCSDMLDETVYTFVSGEDLIANKSYKDLVAGAYTTLAWHFQWGNYHNVVNFDCDYQSGPTWAFGALGAGNFYENGDQKNFYSYYHTAIHRANYHSFLIDQMDIPENEKNNAMGELAFLKAWAYFNLVQFYGDVCLYKKSISDGADLMIPRSPIKDVYEHIIERLIFAEENMYSRKDEKYTKGHPSKGTATGLLAKVYCTIGSASMPKGNKITVSGGPGDRLDDDGVTRVRIPFPAKLTFEKDQVVGYGEFDSKDYYRMGMDKAKKLIDSEEFAIYDSQEELWSPSSKNGKEFMFTLQTLPGSEELSHYMATDYAGNYSEFGHLERGYYLQRDHWLQMFDQEDERITWGVIHRWPGSYSTTTGLLTWYYYPARDSVKVRLEQDGYQKTDVLSYSSDRYGSKLMKFRQLTVSIDEYRRTDFNFPYMRYAETLLLYAEADNEINNGPSAQAIAQVEKLNKRNNSKTVSELGQSAPWTQETFRSYILEERAKEFAAEGIRRFDLLRWGIYLQTMNAIGNTDENNVIKRREARHLLLPLPENEVNTNKFIEVNNPGW